MNDSAQRGSQLWRASFTAPAHAMPGLLDELELLASSLSIFEDAADADARTVRWRVDLIFEDRPELAPLAAELERLCARFGFHPGEPVLAPIPARDWLAATAMQTRPIQVRRRPRRVLDLGCGSGVLGLAAARLWASSVLLVDNDPVAVRVAAENARQNGLAARVRAVLGEGWSASILRRRGPYDLVLANILADPLIEMAGELARNVARGGHAVLSGFVARDADRVAQAHRRHGLRPVARVDREPWVALVLRR
jgi:ribosomal protein L11 methyltransferase